MAVIARKAVGGMAMLALFTLSLRADRAADVLARVNYVATSLTAGNAADAMSPFDKSFANYQKLSDYFDGLTNAFQLVNEVDVTDEQDSETETKLTVNWTLTLTDLKTNYTNRRTAELTVRLALKNGKWRITDISPIDLFNPQQKN